MHNLVTMATLHLKLTLNAPSHLLRGLSVLSKKVKRAKMSFEDFRWDRDVEKHLV